MSVEHYEVPSFVQPRRVRPGSWARVTRMDTEAHRIDEMISGYADTVLPWLNDTPGFVSSERGRGRV